MQKKITGVFAGVRVEKKFATDATLSALAWRRHTPPYIVSRPAHIKLEAEGRNLGNEALIFHEALHGFTGRHDNEIMVKLLGLSRF